MLFGVIQKVRSLRREEELVIEKQTKTNKGSGVHTNLTAMLATILTTILDP